MRTNADTGGGGQRQCGRPQKTTVTCGNIYFLIINISLNFSLLFDLILPLGSVHKKWRYLVFSLGLAMSPCHIKLPEAASVPISSYTVQ